MIKFNNYNQQKLETIFKENEFQVRYGKGQFNAGYCILESKNIVVVNKFFTVEAKINALIDLLNHIAIDFDRMSDASLKMLKQVGHTAESEATKVVAAQFSSKEVVVAEEELVPAEMGEEE